MSADHAGCPRCGASVRAGSQWCTLCYADLRPPPDPQHPAVVAAAELGVPTGLAPADQAPAALALADLALAGAAPQPVSRGRHARREPVPDEAQAEGLERLDVDAMLAQLAAQSPQPMGGLLSRLDSTGARVGLMIGGVVAFTVGIFLLLALVGSLL